MGQEQRFTLTERENIPQSSLMLFCDQCGLANDLMATHCSACQHLMTRVSRLPDLPPVAPVTIAPPKREITPDRLFTPNSQNSVGDIQPGTILAECYRIEEEIGRGGFSIVYRAVEVDDPSRQVAIKRIPLSTLTPSQIIDATETFNRELSMLKRFTGTRGVPKFYGHLEDQENWYLVMEYIKGETLEECLQKSPDGYFDEIRTIRIGIKLAEIFYGLHAEQPPVIFRDTKPANVILTHDQELYLIDFGIARNFTQGKARDTTPLGSPGYAPPEQYGRAQTNWRADIYSLGATLQTLATGRDPLELAAGEPSRSPKPLSPKLRALLDEMLALDQFHRPIDMHHVQTRLENMLPLQAMLSSNISQGVLLVAPLVVLGLFVIISLTSIWAGTLFLINTGASMGVYSKWFDKQQLIGSKAKDVCRTIVNFSLKLFPLLWIIFILVQFFWK